MQTQIKIEITVEIEKVQKALKNRNIVVNAANTNRFLKLMKNASFMANDPMYEDITEDREILLMYGFKMEKMSKEE